MRPTGHYNGALKPSCSRLPFSFPFLPFNCRSVDTVKCTLWSVDPFSRRNMVIISSQRTKTLKVWVADFQLVRGKPSAGQIRRQIGCFSSIFFFFVKVFKFSNISHSQAGEWGVSGNIVFTCMWMCRLSSFDWALPVSIAGDSTVCLCHLLPRP